MLAYERQITARKACFDRFRVVAIEQSMAATSRQTNRLSFLSYATSPAADSFLALRFIGHRDVHTKVHLGVDGLFRT